MKKQSCVILNVGDAYLEMDKATKIYNINLAKGNLEPIGKLAVQGKRWPLDLASEILLVTK